MGSIRIAVPSDGDNFDVANVDEHFGRAPYYLLINIESGRVKHVESIRNPAIEHSPGTIPELLKKYGVNVVICMGMGRRARMFFEEFGIQIITGARGRIAEIINQFIEGKLESVPYTPQDKWREKIR